MLSKVNNINESKITIFKQEKDDEKYCKSPMIIKITPELQAMLDEMVNYTYLTKSELVHYAIRKLYKERF